MGYVNNIGILSGTTCTKELSISWTKLGREYLIGKRAGRKKGITIKYFSLQDKDINYNTDLNNRDSFVPNITGIDNQCINGNLVDEVQSLVNLNKEGLILVKDFNIYLKDNENDANCPTNQVIYDAFIDGVSIFKTKPNYYNMYFSHTTGGPYYDYGNSYFKASYIKDSLSSIIDVTFSQRPFGTSEIIYAYNLKIKSLPGNSVVTDNIADICGNKFSSTITFEQKVIIDPNAIDTDNISTYEVPNC